MIKKYFQIKSVWYIGLASAVLTVLIVFNSTLFPYTLSIELLSPKEGHLQIYYCSQGSYAESESIRIPVKASNDHETYSARLTQKDIRNIRIDPPGDFNIKSISLFNQFHLYKFQGPELFEKLKPLHHIQSIKLTDNKIEGIVNGEDPYLQLIGQPIINQVSFINYLGFFLSVFLAFYASFSFLWNRFLKYDYFPDGKNLMHLDIPDYMFRIFVFSIFAWFAYQTVFYAINIAEHIAPDEGYHLLLSIFQSESINFHNQDTPRSFYLGAISVRPFLYHLLMGKLLMLNVFDLSTLIYLRLLNVLISLTTLYLTFLLAKEITKNKWVQLAALIIQTNILMFVFISSMVSYDNLTNLISVGSFLVLIRFLKNFSRFNLLMLIITMLAGALTKITYGPIVIIQLIILISYSKAIFKNRHRIFYKPFSVKDGALLFSLIILFSLNINLYVNNLINYDQVQPKTGNVFGHEKAYKYYSQYQRVIDLGATVSDRPLMPFAEYFRKYIDRTEQTIFGVCGHKNLLRTSRDIFIYGTIGLLSILLFALRYKKTLHNSALKIILFSFISYALVILLANYKSYYELRSFGLALQGRYNFPVIALANVFIAYGLLSWFRDRTKIVLLILLAAFLVFNNYFWFISHAGSIWYLN